MKKNLNVLLFICCMLHTVLASAQDKLVFKNQQKQKEIEIAPGSLVKLDYKGYLEQRDKAYGIVVDITDSLVYIESLDKTKKGIVYLQIKDIVGFRKFYKSRLVLEPLLQVSFAVANVGLFYWLESNKPNISFGNRFAISVGSSIITSTAVKLIFNKKIKNYSVDGWTLKR